MSNAAAASAFTVKLDAWLAKSKESARLKFLDVCLEAAERVVHRTPVDTGFCRAMWSVSINQPPVAKPVQPGDAWKAIGGDAAAALAIGKIEPVVMSVQIADRVWIYNATAYAPKLEDGHSKQAPLGMVKVTVAEMKAKYS